jgi:hypothetical protein
VNSGMIHLIHCKNLCKCYIWPPLSTTIKGKKIMLKKKIQQWNSTKYTAVKIFSRATLRSLKAISHPHKKNKHSCLGETWGERTQSHWALCHEGLTPYLVALTRYTECI